MPCVLRLVNASGEWVKLYWLNYDGALLHQRIVHLPCTSHAVARCNNVADADAGSGLSLASCGAGDQEYFAKIPPGGLYTVDTFETHPWRVLSADSGDIVTEFVAAKGVQTFRVGAGVAGASGSFTPAPLSASADPGEFEGFDGIGRSEEAYAPAEVRRPQQRPPPSPPRSPHHTSTCLFLPTCSVQLKVCRHPRPRKQAANRAGQHMPLTVVHHGVGCRKLRYSSGFITFDRPTQELCGHATFSMRPHTTKDRAERMRAHARS